jgi:hypothetical protein
MFLMFLTFVVMLSGFAVLVWFGFHRIALHLRGNPEATKAVVEHVLIPLFGRKEEPDFEREPDGTIKCYDEDAA